MVPDASQPESFHIVASKLDLGVNASGYFLAVTDRDPEIDRVHLQFGPIPTTVALFMKANDVTHFDYHSTLFDNSEATENFIQCALAVGFEV